MNLKAITNIQRQTDILSDGHQEVAHQAMLATSAIITLDNHIEKSKEAERPASGLGVYTSRVQRHLNKLQDQLRAQSLRALRVCDEVEQIKNNLKVI